LTVSGLATGAAEETGTTGALTVPVPAAGTGDVAGLTGAAGDKVTAGWEAGVVLGPLSTALVVFSSTFEVTGVGEGTGAGWVMVNKTEVAGAGIGSAGLEVGGAGLASFLVVTGSSFLVVAGSACLVVADSGALLVVPGVGVGSAAGVFEMVWLMAEVGATTVLAGLEAVGFSSAEVGFSTTEVDSAAFEVSTAVVVSTALVVSATLVVSTALEVSAVVEGWATVEVSAAGVVEVAGASVDEVVVEEAVVGIIELEDVGAAETCELDKSALDAVQSEDEGKGAVEEVKVGEDRRKP
jgi:hypothetical protein